MSVYLRINVRLYDIMFDESFSNVIKTKNIVHTKHTHESGIETPQNRNENQSYSFGMRLEGSIC